MESFRKTLIEKQHLVRDSQRVVIIGGGPVGLELAGEIRASIYSGIAASRISTGAPKNAPLRPVGRLTRTNRSISPNRSQNPTTPRGCKSCSKAKERADLTSQLGEIQQVHQMKM